LFSLNATTGALEWYGAAGYTDPILLASGILLATNRTGTDLARVDSESGSILWQRSNTSQIGQYSLGMNAAHTLVIARCQDGVLCGIHSTDGTMAWSQNAVPSGDAIAVDEATDRVFAGVLAAVDASTGNLIWQTEASRDIERLEFCGSHCLMAMGLYTLSLYDAATGRLTWQRNVTSVHGLALDGEGSAVVAEYDSLHGVGMDGQTLWRWPSNSKDGGSPMRIGRSIAADAHARIYTQLADSPFELIAALHGATLWSLPMSDPGGWLMAAPAIGCGYLVFIASGDVIRIGST
jgi:hypothetical protein